MNNLKSKLFILIGTLSLLVALEFLYIDKPIIMENINNTLIDSAFKYRGEKEADKRIIIIDIDEKSLASLGQWPWSRHKVAQILDNLTKADVGIIGLDMVFAEKDRSSPRTIAAEINIEAENLIDYDEFLAQTLQNTPTITGFVFNLEQATGGEAPNTNAMFIEHNKGENTYLLEAKGITTNIEILQQSSYSSGSFNTLPDDDGIVRYVPLLFSYEDTVYPSLSFEMIRIMLGEKKVHIVYDENGVDFIKLGEIEIPTDAQGRLFVNYRGPKNKYHYISAIDVFNNTFDKKEIEGSIVLLGTSAVGLLDLRATPYDSAYPGVEVHANVLDNILNNNLIASPSYAMSIDMLSIFVSILVVSLIVSFATPLVSFGLILVFFTLQATFYQTMLFEEHLLLNYAFPLLSALLTMFAITFVKIYQENRQKVLIADKFSKKVSPQVVDKLLRSDKDAFSVAQTEVTIFFSDVRNFTTISEGFENPKDLIEYLNTYMSPMSQIIIDHEGTIDKYIGDAIMAYWNAPLEVKNHADKALSAAIKQIDALKNLNITLKEKNYPPIEIGIGIHTGEAIVGEMGSEGRSDYTVIGDSINLGSRIEGLCKPYGAKILISESTKRKLTQTYQIREVDKVQVKGKEEAVTIYEVCGFGTFEGEELKIEEIYKEAKELYSASKFQEAYACFFQAYELQEHKLFTLYMDRCATYMKNHVKEVEEVFKFTTK
jgi:adenylate cyclase